MGIFGQFAASSQFYLYGRKHFTKTGYLAHQSRYEKPDLLEQPLDGRKFYLTDKVFLITGANSGVGKEVAEFLASKGATIYMACRSRERALAAQAAIKEQTGNHKVHVLVADVGVEADVRRCWQEFAEQAPCREASGVPRLDGLVCNAGALANEKSLTEDGVEVTFASHLLFGTYLLGSLALPALEATPGSRLVVVSSGGMYNFAFPTWDVATSTSVDPTVKYDGQAAYAYAKRGQVLLCERWAAQHPKVKVVTCHPGWTGTPAVESAYGETKKYLEPMRSPWEGAEGIAWLCVAPTEKLEPGAFYLDRAPQAKHIAGPFFTEGSHTKNSPEEVDAMMQRLEEWANGRSRPTDLLELAEAQAASAQACTSPLVAMEGAIDVSRFMGKWYVYANIPTVFDKDTANNVEEYTFDAATRTVDVDFTFSSKDLKKQSVMKQRAKVKTEAGTEWAISPKFGVYLPLGIPYLVVHCAEDYSSTIIGVPDRSYVWVMTRVPHPDPAVAKELTRKCQVLGYDVRNLVVVPQTWGEEASDGDGGRRPTN